MATRDGAAIDAAPQRVVPMTRVLALGKALVWYRDARDAHDADVTNAAKLRAKVDAGKAVAVTRGQLLRWQRRHARWVSLQILIAKARRRWGR